MDMASYGVVERMDKGTDRIRELEKIATDALSAPETL